MKKSLVFVVILLFVFSSVIPADTSSSDAGLLITLRNTSEDVVVVSDTDPYFGLLGSSIACWYDGDQNTSDLKPLLVAHNHQLTDAQQYFLDQFTTDEPSLLVLGESIDSSFEKIQFSGNASSVSLQLATYVFETTDVAVILPYGVLDEYQLSLVASPLASYLNCPLLIYDDNQQDIEDVLEELSVTHVYLIGDVPLVSLGIQQTSLPTVDDIQNMILTVITELFNEINYLTLTNPADSIPLSIQELHTSVIQENFRSATVTFLGKERTLFGTRVKQFNITIPSGIIHVSLYGTIMEKPTLFDPVLYMTLFDPSGNIVAYSNSFAYDIGETMMETITCNASGEYTLEVELYHGLFGGFFSQRGFSFLNHDLEVKVNISTLDSPHWPLLPKISMTAPYLTSVHGGIIIAETAGGLTHDDYVVAADGCGSGPWFNESLHAFNNQQVNTTVETLQQTLLLLENHGLLDSYLDGASWLAILADTNMVPMYYYSPSQQIPEKGLPSDNPYSFNWNLSVGRVIGWDVQDVSVLQCRTFFYEQLCGQPSEGDDWHQRFNFVFGEGFGETGGLFHQIPYSREIREYGFETQVFGDLRNGRVFAELKDVYTGANYIEYLGHGDWFWFPPSLYGFDTYSKAIDVAHAKNWVYEKPSVFLSSACLMGRIDGLKPRMNIGLAMLHAGCNAFVGNGRETGQEAGLTTLENHLIVDDWSIGEALRGEKRVDQEVPTFYVRSVFGDPAFNPYEPHNGFHDQGRPTFETR